MDPCPQRIAITLGDAAGVGPELVLRALADRSVRASGQMLVYGNEKLLRRVAAATALSFPPDVVVVPAHTPSASWPNDRPVIVDFPFPEVDTIVPGKVCEACGRQAYRWIEAAVADTLAGRTQALVTGPINKKAMHEAGYDFPGHTELLGHLTGVDHPDMIFYSPRLTLGLVTIHEALARVPQLLSAERIFQTLERACAIYQRRHTQPPRIGVLGLNPHAGEQGLFGDEEARMIAPAVQAARDRGYCVAGPLVPDTAFARATGPQAALPFDVCIAMYHDQGLIPFKMLAFDEGVNVTAGLPFLRTSPDHGTAFDLAWKGIARPTSLIQAILLAAGRGIE